jgi:hypothetical protein
MKLCYDCRRVSPREAVFCAFCNRSFTGRVCPRGHTSPPYARCCIQCGAPETELSVPTRSLNLSFLPPMLSACFLLGGGWLVWTLISPAVSKTTTNVVTGAKVAFIHYAQVFLLLFFATFFLPGRLGDNLRRVFWRTLGMGINLFLGTLSSIIRFLTFFPYRRR